MPLPALAGLPWLAGILGGLFGALIDVFARFLTKRLAIVAAAVALIVGLTTAFFATLNSLAAGLIGVMPPDMVALAGHFLPSNTDACISAYLAAYAARWVYEWNVKVIQMKLI